MGYECGVLPDPEVECSGSESCFKISETLGAYRLRFATDVQALMKLCEDAPVKSVYKEGEGRWDLQKAQERVGVAQRHSQRRCHRCHPHCLSRRNPSPCRFCGSVRHTVGGSEF